MTIVEALRKIVAKENKNFIGQTLDVCYEGIDYAKAKFFGRTQYQSPEIDTLVYFKSKQTAELGDFYPVKIKKTKGYDLEGERE